VQVTGTGFAEAFLIGVNDALKSAGVFFADELVLTILREAVGVGVFISWSCFIFRQLTTRAGLAAVVPLAATAAVVTVDMSSTFDP